MKNENLKLIIVSMLLAICIIVILVSGTYAFFTASSSNNNTIQGESAKFNVDIAMTTVKAGANLVPLSDSDIDKAITSSYDCIDDYGNTICGIYKVDVKNVGDASTLYGFVSASTSTFVTSNLRYKVYTFDGSNYTPVSDALALSNTKDEKVYFSKSNTQYSFSLNTNATQTYYVVFWISGIPGDQNDDMEKTFNGVVGIESTMGEHVTASFSVGS